MSLETGLYTIQVNDDSKKYLGLDDGEALVVAQDAEFKWEVTKLDGGYEFHAYDNPSSIYLIQVLEGTPLTSSGIVQPALFDAIEVPQDPPTDFKTYQITIKDADGVELAWEADPTKIPVVLGKKGTMNDKAGQFWLFTTV